MRARMDRAAAAVNACYVAGDDVRALRSRLLGQLRHAVPIDAAFFATADPETLLFTSAAADEPLGPAGPRFLANEFGPATDVNRFAALARARRPIATLDEATRGRRAASVRFREILAPLGLGDELRVALRAGGLTWGFMCLHREGRTGFAPQEIALVARVAPHIGAALRRVAAAALARSGAEGEVSVVVATEDRVAAITCAAAAALDDVGGRPLAVGDPLPLPLRALARRLGALRLLGRGGAWLEAHAARLHARADDGADAATTVAITLAPPSARTRSSLRLATWPLTPAQRRVAALVLQGLSTREISAELAIGDYTVQDHLKVVFDAAGVSSRRELVARLLG
jgi:DNA-binding NarL/FixJ family response regulator